MLGLSSIGDTVMQVALAITAALEIDTEIIDSKLKIIGGTGRYAAKIGSYEENGNINSGLIYSKLLKSGERYVCIDPQNDLDYRPEEGELAEICCPIRLEGEVVGLIGLVAFSESQRKKIAGKCETLAVFLERMADLIASKLAQTQSSNQLKAILESMHEGLMAVDENFKIVSCNNKCEELLGLSRYQLESKKLSEIWDNEEVNSVIETGVAIKDKEIVYRSEKGKKKRFLSTIMPINEAASADKASSILGAMMLFQDISDARERIYKIAAMGKNTEFADIIGESDTIRSAKQRALQVATSDSTVLITGESGTGKELFARAIHYASSRKDNAFVAINCGAIPEMLLESELFGYEKGAFTGADKSGKPGKFEIAHNGTIFLDEIGDLPLHLQVKLLNAIQNRQIDRIGGIEPIDVNVRIIAATNKNLDAMILMKEFREDLFFRLNVIPLIIPALRERVGDVELLLGYALKKFNALLQKKIITFSEPAMKALLRYDWPGNVRELENVVEYAVNMENGPRIKLENLPDKIQKVRVESKNRSMILKENVDAYQRQLIQDCLTETGYSLEGKIRAARLLGISESTLYRRLRELDIRE
jgi:PAS domain S-box-containing protein